MDGSFRINAGLRCGRQLLLQLTDMGIPVGCELLDTISPQFIGDLVSWGAIGARTTESQLHRELASGVSFPVGFKNGTDGNVDIAIDAINAARHPHHFLGVTHQGLAAITRTTGNQDCHVILRGGKSGPNYSQQDIRTVCAQLTAAQLPAVVMVDCSHGNSCKDFRKQAQCLEELCRQIGEEGDRSIVGVMIESNLVEGKQSIPSDGDLGRLVYGQSVTDACVGWAETEMMLRRLQQAVKQRRVKCQNK
jgi:3-deoxy-7-phosphoheptulonate synthase